MNKIDKIFKETITQILEEGCSDKYQNVRPMYVDGKPAYTKFITQVFEKYDISKGEFPITTLRHIAWKSGIKEILAIYQGQENTKENFEKYGVKWWTPWFNEQDNLGRAYPYNLESHRQNEVTKDLIRIKKRKVDKKFSEPLKIEDKYINNKLYTRNIYDGYLGNYKDILNYSEEEVEILKTIWFKILEFCYQNEKVFVHQEWHCFANFLRDVRYLPQYHLAKENKFEDWVLDINYYDSNCYSKNTCVFLDKPTHILYKEYPNLFLDKDISNSEYIYRYELSRNQVNELIKELKDNPYGRRHIISLWNWSNINKKTLVECAYEVIFTVRNGYLDMTLIQRSSDYLVAGHINKIQYVAFLLMIAKSVGLNPGVFGHLVQNLHIYDRHVEQANVLLRRESSCKQPKLILDTNKTDFYSFTVDDFKIVDYEPIQPNLKFELGI